MEHTLDFAWPTFILVHIEFKPPKFFPPSQADNLGQPHDLQVFRNIYVERLYSNFLRDDDVT